MIPVGYCQCGCGGVTNLARQDRPDAGWVKGEPLRYILGHAHRKKMRKATPEAFWLKVEKTETCWLWRGNFTPNGYGTYAMFVDGDRRKRPAHRLAYMLLVGEIPEGLELDHLCRNPPCVNPAHLEPVTHAENMRRTRRTHCSSGHEWTAENTRHAASGARRCRECERAREMRRRKTRPGVAS